MSQPKSTQRALLEIAALLLVGWVVSHLAGWHLPGLNLLAVPVALAGIELGFWTGVAIGLLAALGAATGVHGAGLVLSDWHTALSQGLGLVTLGALTGLVGDRQAQALRQALEETHEALRGRRQLAGRLEALTREKEQLERLYARHVEPRECLEQALKALEPLDLPTQLTGSLFTIAKHTEASAIALYRREGDRLVLSRALDDRPERPTTIGALHWQTALTSRGARPCLDSEVLGAPMPLVAPLVSHDGDCLGLLALEELPFERCSPGTASMLELAADWLAAVLAGQRTAFREAASQELPNPLSQGA